eukprot:CAMPEP_0198147762 /NCGR_PEP_ID=MMETSP1443-20131203/37636_1 /TAXON_ID=186043 /ORGANISM="Entomoneis sp., Strain CCMP2396" /LENGTH=427 /DNA_ID=CAMNT_0043812227 /DNA_START=109 /DNA_END=1389 /DNA_ORIENTATION=+
MSIPVPEQWPQEVLDKYEAVRHLGKGGFASVILGKRKEPEEGKPKFVAIKVVGSKYVTRQDVGYAHREMDILAELNHPNIMKVLEHWEPPRKDHQCAAIMALTFAKGPTLEQLLKKGGALSSVFGRIVCAQIVDVLAHIHSRAVLHRDIKPDNMIVTGSAYEMDEIWDEILIESEIDNWDELTKKWKLTFVDFGFARALSKEDMAKPAPKTTKNTSSNLDGSVGASNSSRKSLSRSVSRAFTRQMSALGHRSYAAPEVMKGVKPNSKHDALRFGEEPVDLTNNLSANVSQYGMMADAFSAGSTMRYAMTGVPPNMTHEQAMASQESVLSKLGCCFGSGGGSSSKKATLEKEPRKVKYREISGISKEAQKLIEGFTQKDVDDRTSIRHARRFPWINDVLSTEAPSTQEVNFLSFTIKGEHGVIAATEE